MEIGSSFGARVDLKPCLALMSISKNDIGSRFKVLYYLSHTQSYRV